MPGQFQRYANVFASLHSLKVIRLQDLYAREYHTFKPDKKLRWMPQMGSVELQVELAHRTISTEVNPLQAAVVELFSYQGR